MTHASVFSGIGGPEVAATMLGWENLFHCEINPFGRAVLDYWYPKAKSYDDITKTDFSEWRGKVDVLTGGFPCQPFSYAGQRRGAEDDRYLWPYMFRCIDQIRPTWVVAENVAGITTMVEQGEVSRMENQTTLFDEGDGVRGYRLRETFTLERISDDLANHGYTVQAVLIPACAVGAPHRRDRVFIVGRRRDDDVKNPMRSGQLCGQHEEQGCEWNERNVGSGDSERICGEGSRLGDTDAAADNASDGRDRGSAPDGRGCAADGGEGLSAVQREFERPRCGDAPADTPCGGEGAPGEGGSVEGNGSNQDKQPCQRRAASEWNSRFYELLRNAADTDRQLRWEQSGEFRLCESEQGQLGGGDSEGGSVAGCGRWRNFPTVSPVHRGNDGLPFPLDDLTLSPAKWRTEALKAYGNAIVPQVMYEIFRAIEIAQK